MPTYWLREERKAEQGQVLGCHVIRKSMTMDTSQPPQVSGYNIHYIQMIASHTDQAEN
jgi:hypothetical protein